VKNSYTFWRNGDLFATKIGRKFSEPPPPRGKRSRVRHTRTELYLVADFEIVKAYACLVSDVTS